MRTATPRGRGRGRPRTRARATTAARRVVEPVAVVYRATSAGWDATSPDFDGWRISGPTPALLRPRAEDEVRFALDRDDVRIAHLLPLTPTA